MRERDLEDLESGLGARCDNVVPRARAAGLEVDEVEAAVEGLSTAHEAAWRLRVAACGVLNQALTALEQRVSAASTPPADLVGDKLNALRLALVDALEDRLMEATRPAITSAVESAFALLFAPAPLFGALAEEEDDSEVSAFSGDPDLEDESQVSDFADDFDDFGGNHRIEAPTAQPMAVAALDEEDEDADDQDVDDQPGALAPAVFEADGAPDADGEDGEDEDDESGAFAPAVFETEGALDDDLEGPADASIEAAFSAEAAEQQDEVFSPAEVPAAMGLAAEFGGGEADLEASSEAPDASAEAKVFSVPDAPESPEVLQEIPAWEEPDEAWEVPVLAAPAQLPGETPPDDAPELPEEAPALPDDAPELPYDAPELPYDAPELPEEEPAPELPEEEPALPDDAPELPAEAPELPEEAPAFPDEAPAFSEEPFLLDDLAPVAEPEPEESAPSEAPWPITAVEEDAPGAAPPSEVVPSDAEEDAAFDFGLDDSIESVAAFVPWIDEAEAGHTEGEKPFDNEPLLTDGTLDEVPQSAPPADTGWEEQNVDPSGGWHAPPAEPATDAEPPAELLSRGPEASAAGSLASRVALGDLSNAANDDVSVLEAPPVSATPMETASMSAAQMAGRIAAAQARPMPAPGNGFQEDLAKLGLLETAALPALDLRRLLGEPPPQPDPVDAAVRALLGGDPPSRLPPLEEEPAGATQDADDWLEATGDLVVPDAVRDETGDSTVAFSAADVAMLTAAAPTFALQDLVPDPWDQLEMDAPDLSGSGRILVTRPPRAPFASSVGLEHGRQFSTGFSVDIGRGGLFVTTSSPPPVGSHVSLFFEMPDGHSVASPGEVCWRRSGGDKGPAGFGVRFLELRYDDRVVIERYVALHGRQRD